MEQHWRNKEVVAVFALPPNGLFLNIWWLAFKVASSFGDFGLLECPLCFNDQNR